MKIEHERTRRGEGEKVVISAFISGASYLDDVRRESARPAMPRLARRYGRPLIVVVIVVTWSLVMYSTNIFLDENKIQSAEDNPVFYRNSQNSDGSYDLPVKLNITSFKERKRSEDKLYESLRQNNRDFTHEYSQEGCVFVDDSEPCEVINTKVTTSLVTYISPLLSDVTRGKFVDPPSDNLFYHLSPALLLDGPDIVVYTRVMLDRLRHRFSKPQTYPTNQFQTNYVYESRLDPRTLAPRGTGRVVGIPAPVSATSGDGPMDPRVFRAGNTTYLMVLMNMDVNGREWRPYPLIWDLVRQRAHVPLVDVDFNPRVPMEKNWSPLVERGEIYFIHNLDPLRVIHCPESSWNCSFIQDDSSRGSRFRFQRRRHTLRGGTPFIAYTADYYVSLAHSVVVDDREGAPFNKVRRYQSHLVVLRRLGPHFRLVYCSAPLVFHSGLYHDISMVTYEGQVLVVNDFVYPVGVVLETKDCLLVGAHVNDHVSVLLRVCGLRDVMTRVMAEEHRTREQLRMFAVQEYVQSTFDRPQ